MFLPAFVVLFTFFRQIIGIDHWLFHLINQVWTNPAFDLIFVFMRQAELWVPFYLFLLVLALVNFGKRGIWWSITLIMTAIISDLVSSSIIKNTIFRLRPCRNPDLADQVRVLANYCPKSSGFTSSHACNHFAVAFFIFITLNQTGSWRWLLFLWAFLISYAQVYVGVHFPLDILGGALAGSIIGYMMSIFHKKQFGTLSLK
ncbi:MAG TPA: phosphatase PAP2 family protein [Puia sp.]|jgi:undecaprenyl-diphosphatase|nr:phosphatase PAP2 family protein [Puia sp.]